MVQDYFVKLQKQEDFIKQKEEEEKLKQVKGSKAAAPKKPAQEPLDEAKEQLIPTNLYKRVRHGVGVQIFPSPEGGFLYKYEGNWDRDRKNGEGRCYFSDKSCYLGQMKYDVMDGYGQHTWENGNIYQGNWKNGRFEGGGKFVHHDVWNNFFIFMLRFFFLGKPFARIV